MLSPEDNAALTRVGRGTRVGELMRRIPCWYGPVRDPATGRWITSHVMNQDFVAWIGQGRIADRTREHLGESDRGKEAAVVARGGEPKGIVRDPAQNVKLALPRVRQGRGAPLGVRPDRPRPMLWHAGQPREIADEYARVWDERLRAGGS